MKICVKCNEVKDFSEFYKNKARSDGLTIYCKTCSKQNVKETYRRNPEKKIWRERIRKKSLTHTFTFDDYEKMIIDQNNQCYICSTDLVNTPHIDHDHATGKVRKLLCHHCNALLGLAREDIQILQNSIDYLITHR